MNLIQRDSTLFRKWFIEMAHLRGLPNCKYQYIVDKYVEDNMGNYVLIDNKYVMCTIDDYADLQHYSKKSTKSFTIHGEIRGEYSDPEDIPLIFQEYPSQKTLRMIGWVSEDNSDGDKPYVIQIPYDTPHLQVGCRVLIPFGLTEGSPDRKVFRITKIAMIAQYPDCYTCTIAPEFETEIGKDNPDYSDTNNNYMRNLK